VGSLTRFTDRSNRSGATLIGFTIPYATLASDFVSLEIRAEDVADADGSPTIRPGLFRLSYGLDDLPPPKGQQVLSLRHGVLRTVHPDRLHPDLWCRRSCEFLPSSPMGPCVCLAHRTHSHAPTSSSSRLSPSLPGQRHHRSAFLPCCTPSSAQETQEGLSWSSWRLASPPTPRPRFTRVG
jgi:hypothetical protein